MKRQRGRGRRSNGANNNPNRHFESNGPDVKIRGSAQQILDKYLQYARDAQSSGDRVHAENYFQHAEHYARVLAAMQPKQPRREEGEDAETGEAAEQSADGETNGSDGASTNGDGRRDRRGRRDAAPAEDGAEPTGQDPLKVIDASETEPEAEGDADAPPRRQRRRRTYKSRDEESVEDGPDGGAPEPEDGVMATLARGRSAEAEVEPASVDAPADSADL